MCDWFTFHVDQGAKMITIEMNMQVLLETQPETYAEADEFCTDTLLPVIDQLRDTCNTHGYSQICIVDLKDVNVLLLSPSILTRLLWNIWDHTKDNPENLIQSFNVTNSNAVFRGIYRASKKILPTYLTNLITIS